MHSAAAEGSTTWSSLPDRKTVACRPAKRSGWMSNCAGMSGKRAPPSGTSESAMSAPGDRGNDAHLVAASQRGAEVVQVSDVLVIEVNVDEAPHLAVIEEALRDSRELIAQVAEQVLNRGAVRFHHR